MAGLKVGRGELITTVVLPTPSFGDPRSLPAVEAAGEFTVPTGTRSRAVYRKFQVAVIADHHGCVDAVFRDVEQVSRDVDIAAFSSRRAIETTV